MQADSSSHHLPLATGPSRSSPSKPPSSKGERYTRSFSSSVHCLPSTGCMGPFFPPTLQLFQVDFLFFPTNTRQSGASTGQPWQINQPGPCFSSHCPPGLPSTPCLCIFAPRQLPNKSPTLVLRRLPPSTPQNSTLFPVRRCFANPPKLSTALQPTNRPTAARWTTSCSATTDPSRHLFFPFSLSSLHFAHSFRPLFTTIFDILRGFH